MYIYKNGYMIFTLHTALSVRSTRKRKASELCGTTKRPKSRGKENEEQLYLVSITYIGIGVSQPLQCIDSSLNTMQDLGQKDFSHVTCSVCGMVYTSGQPTDQAEHLHFHKSYLSGVNFPVSHPISGNVLLALPGALQSPLCLAVPLVPIVPRVTLVPEYNTVTIQPLMVIPCQICQL